MSTSKSQYSASIFTGTILAKKPSIHYCTSLQFSPITALRKHKWVMGIEPGHLATRFFSTICASQTIWRLTEWQCFLFKNAYSSSWRVLKATCLHWTITLIAFGKKDRHCFKLHLDVGLPTRYGKVIYLWFRLIILSSHTAQCWLKYHRSVWNVPPLTFCLPY